MKKFFKDVWKEFKNKGETIGLIFCVIGFIILIVTGAWNLSKSLELLGVSLGLLSLGLAMISLGMSDKSDIRYTEILTRLDKNVSKVLEYYPSDKIDIPHGSSKDVVIKAPIAEAFVKGYVPEVTIKPEYSIEISKIKAQARLDADTMKVGYVRGELYQIEDGSWAIHWGGKYQL